MRAPLALTLGLIAANFMSSCFLPHAQAQEAADEVTDREARNLFEAGRAAFAAGRFDDALGDFRRAYELSQRPVLLFNVGQSLDRLRRDEEALNTFERYLELVPDAANRAQVAARVRILRQALADAEQTTDATPADSPPLSPAQVAADSQQNDSSDSGVAGGAMATDGRHRDDPQSHSVAKTWWFWTIIGSVAAGAVIGTVLATRSGGGEAEAIPGDYGAVLRALRTP